MSQATVDDARQGGHPYQLRRPLLKVHAKSLLYCRSDRKVVPRLATAMAKWSQPRGCLRTKLRTILYFFNFPATEKNTEFACDSSSLMAVVQSFNCRILYGDGVLNAV